MQKEVLTKSFSNNAYNGFSYFVLIQKLLVLGA